MSEKIPPCPKCGGEVVFDDKPIFYLFGLIPVRHRERYGCIKCKERWLFFKDKSELRKDRVGVYW